MSEPTFHRLHPATIAIQAVQAIKSLLPILFISILSMFRGGGTNSITEMMFSLFGLLTIGPAIAQYYTFGYAIHGDNLVIREGIFTKKKRTIPINRIQNINIQRGVLHRILGAVRVQIETAGSAQAEAALPAVTEAQVDWLKKGLLSSNRQGDAIEAEPASEARVLYQASTKELFLAGATQNRALAIVSAIFGFIYLIPNWEKMLGDSAIAQWRAGPSAWTFWAVMLLLLFTIGWIFSVVSTFLQYWNFELTLDDGRLKRSFGAINQTENVLPIKRIQVVRISQTLLQRWMKLCQMRVDTAGSFAGQQQDQQQQAAAVQANSVISPLMELSESRRLLENVLIDYTPFDDGWSGISPKTIRRHSRTMLIFALFVTAASFYWLEWWSLASLPLFAGLGFLIGWLKHKSYRWNLQDGLFVAEWGIVSRSLSAAPVSKIQSVSVYQSPIQRRFGLSTLAFRTAAMSGSAAVEMPDLPEEAAHEIAERLQKQSGELSWLNPDGF
jgi:putative membrane protein